MPGSITDAELCEQAMRGVTHVFHLAVAMREGGKGDEFFEPVNLEGTRRLLEAAAAGRVERFVYCSTIGIYGHRAPGVTSEDSPLAPGQHLRAHQGRGRALVRELAPTAALPFVILRPADVYGPRDQRLLKLFKGVSAGPFPSLRRRQRAAGTWCTWTTWSPLSSPPASGRRGRRGDDRGGPAAVHPARADRGGAPGRPAAAASAAACRWPRCSAAAAVVEDVCQALNLDPPIYRRRMDFFTSDSAFDTSRARRVLDWDAAGRRFGDGCAPDVRGLPPDGAR